MQGFSAHTFSNRLYRNLWGHVVKTALKKMKYGYNDVAIMNSSSWHLHQPIYVLIWEQCSFLMTMSSECAPVIYPHVPLLLLYPSSFKGEAKPVLYLQPCALMFLCFLSCFFGKACLFVSAQRACSSSSDFSLASSTRRASSLAYSYVFSSSALYLLNNTLHIIAFSSSMEDLIFDGTNRICFEVHFC